jgi:hypothetical protein
MYSIYEAHCQNLEVRVANPKTNDWNPLVGACSNCTDLDAIAQHRIRIDSCNWRIGIQWNPVRQL